jgi:hypothetical protein
MRLRNNGEPGSWVAWRGGGGLEAAIGFVGANIEADLMTLHRGGDGDVEVDRSAVLIPDLMVDF